MRSRAWMFCSARFSASVPPSACRDKFGQNVSARRCPHSHDRIILGRHHQCCPCHHAQRTDVPQHGTLCLGGVQRAKAAGGTASAAFRCASTWLLTAARHAPSGPLSQSQPWLVLQAVNVQSESAV